MRSIEETKAPASPADVGHRRRPVHALVGAFIALLFLVVEILLFASYRQASRTGEQLGTVTDTTTTLANLQREALQLQLIVREGGLYDLQETELRRGLLGQQLNVLLGIIDARELEPDITSFRSALVRFDQELAVISATPGRSDAEIASTLLPPLRDLAEASKRLFDQARHRLYGAIYADLQHAKQGQLLLGGLSSIVLILGTGLAFVLRRSVRKDFARAHGALISEMHERETLQKQLSHQAYHDSLTGLGNRALFLHEVTRALARSARSGASTALVYLDLDDFKSVNDTMGHAAGDELLKTVAKRLEDCVRETDLVARLGGDEFAILLENAGEAGDVIAVVDRIIESMARPLRLGTHIHTVTASLGVVPSVDPGVKVDDLIRCADMAMYEAKAGGKSAYVVFEESMRIVARRKSSLQRDLTQAVERREFVSHYQPIVNLKAHRIEGVEALVRWQHPSGDLLPPGHFLPTAEETGLIKDIGDQVLVEAATAMAEWQRTLPGLGDVFVSVNVSGQQLDDPAFPDRVEAVLRETGLRPQSLVLEITESTMMRDPEAAAGALTRLRVLGVRIAIDDFGTGYSSLSYLRLLPVDILKIDRSFVSSLPEEHAIAATITHLADELGMVAIAEGIEQADQWRCLEDMGCAMGQGFLIARPESAELVGARLAAAARGDIGSLFSPGKAELVSV